MIAGKLIGLLGEKINVVYVSGRREWVNGLGVIDTSILADKNFGDHVNILGFSFKIIKPNLEDVLNSIERGPQAINIKDMGKMILKSGIGCRSKVIEVGIGSGFLTVSLLYYLKEGKLISYDISRKNAERVLELLKRLGLDSRWEYRIGDIADGIIEKDADAVFLDVPEPWQSLDKTKESMKYGGSIMAYIPNITQVNIFVQKLRENGFSSIEISEIIERHWISGERELRPENIGLLHTSFIVFARKL